MKLSFVLVALSLGQALADEWPFDLTSLSAPDGSITANFVSFGATLTELWVKDRDGNARDIVLGYDDPRRLMTDPDHPVFSPIVGRYANRIRKGLFSIPISADPDPNAPNTYHIPTNDGDGAATLHGGLLGWDRRNWTISEKTPTSVTYMHVDAADEGFPGTVTAYAKHEVQNGGVLETSVYAEASELTPIMLTQHTYWNLDAFQDGTETILGHTLRIDADRVIQVDNFNLPTGDFINVTDTPFDFREAQEIGARWDQTKGLCGAQNGCQGYDHCFLFEDQSTSLKTATSLWSDKSGIRVDMTTNQPAVQVYTSFWMNTYRKRVHGGPDLRYGKWSAVALEQQGWIAAINTPQWNVDQIHGPDRPYSWSTKYKFSTVD